MFSSQPKMIPSKIKCQIFGLDKSITMPVTRGHKVITEARYFYIPCEEVLTIS